MSILFQVNVSDEKICVTEIEIVSSCPVTEQEHNEAARRKHCSSMKSTCTNQVEKLEYHCLPNAWGDKLFEMCATDKEIIGNYRYIGCCKYTYYRCFIGVLKKKNTINLYMELI